MRYLEALDNGYKEICVSISSESIDTLLEKLKRHHPSYDFQKIEHIFTNQIAYSILTNHFNLKPAEIDAIDADGTLNESYM